MALTFQLSTSVVMVRLTTHEGHTEQEQQPKAQQPPSSQGQTGGRRNASGDETVIAKDEAAAVKQKNTEQQQQQDETAAAAVRRKNGEGERAGEEEEENEVREEDVRELYDDKTQVCEMPEARGPKLFVDGLTLRRYQRQALAWMIQREKKRYVTEEDCTGLSMGGGAAAARAAAAGGGAGEPVEEEDIPVGAAESGRDGGSSSAQSKVSIRDGCVRVASWGRLSAAGGAAGGSDCGGGAHVALHPLWERRAAASVVVPMTTKTGAASTGTGGIFDVSEGSLDDDYGAGLVPRSDTVETAAGAGEQVTLLSQPEAFYVNVYSRRFQREFPPASLGCRGGILADEMGMGKVTDCGQGGGGDDGEHKPLSRFLVGPCTWRAENVLRARVFGCGRVSRENLLAG